MTLRDRVALAILNSDRTKVGLPAATDVTQLPPDDCAQYRANAEAALSAVAESGEWVPRSDKDKWAEECAKQSARLFRSQQTCDALRTANAALAEALKALSAWHDHPALTGLPHGSPVPQVVPSFHETVEKVKAALAKHAGRETT